MSHQKLAGPYIVGNEGMKLYVVMMGIHSLIPYPCFIPSFPIKSGQLEKGTISQKEDVSPFSTPSIFVEGRCMAVFVTTGRFLNEERP